MTANNTGSKPGENIQPEKPRRAMPHEHKELARGSGPAAILLFLHIAAAGYLFSAVLFLLISNTAAFWNLVPYSAGVIFYLPAAFAAMTYLPTDKLTKIVALVAAGLGIFSAVVYGAGLITQYLQAENEYRPGFATLLAVLFGVVGGIILRGLFSALLGERRRNFKKMEDKKRISE